MGVFSLFVPILGQPNVNVNVNFYVNKMVRRPANNFIRDGSGEAASRRSAGAG
jgi:hypothetical protein